MCDRSVICPVSLTHVKRLKILHKTAYLGIYVTMRRLRVTLVNLEKH